MRATYTNALVVGEYYDFYVDKSAVPAALIRRGKLSDVNLTAQYARLIWNGQLYDVPLRLVKNRWRRVKQPATRPSRAKALK